MAWETVEHCCGHQVDHQLYGNRAWRERQAARLAQELCPDCKQAARDEENKKAAAANAEAGYPPLEGTEKQIAWAESIRRDMLSVAEVVDAAWMAMQSDPAAWKAVLRGSGLSFGECEHFLRNAVTEAGYETREAFMKALCGQTQASWWIDHRGNYYAVAKDIAAEIKADAPDKQEDSFVAREAKQEAILRPESAAVCDKPAEIALAGGIITVKSPEKREDFQAVMRVTGCKWDADRRRWTFKPGPRDGDILDRMAEITHALIAAGFLVCLFNAEARRRALEHDFTPRQTRWIGLEGDRLTITWSRADDFYESARELRGSRYKDGRVLVPTNAIDDVVDWAEENGFALDPEVQKLLENRREALVNAIVLRNPKVAGKAGKAQGKHRDLQAPSETSIDDELLDKED